MTEKERASTQSEEPTVMYGRPEENPCPQCGGPMVWIAGGPRCKNCGFKESCCF